MDIFANFIYENTSSVCKSSLSSFCLKSADVASLHKKVKNDLKKAIDLLVFYRYTDTVKNFWEGHVWTNVKVFENFLSTRQCDFRKCYRTQHCILALLEKWKCAADRGKTFGALLTDLSKVFDCLDYELLIAKLIAYGFSLPALKLVHNYLHHKGNKEPMKTIFIALG